MIISEKHKSMVRNATRSASRIPCILCVAPIIREASLKDSLKMLNSNLKYEYCHKTNKLILDRVLHNTNVFPYNYGFIPNTKLRLDEGGDGDAIDVLVMNDLPIEKGERVKIKVIGMLKLLDKNKIDHKIISVKVGSIFEKINSLRTLENEHSGILEIFSIWFQNYKGEKIKILGFEEKKKAKKFIEKFVQ